MDVAVRSLDMTSLATLEAGKFDVVLHKMVKHIALEHSDVELARELHTLERYFDAHPDVPFEPIGSVRLVNDRRAVSTALKHFCVQTLDGRVAHPPFFAVSSVEQAHAVADQVDFAFPWIAKPFVADGVPESHDLGMVMHTAGLLQVPMPYIIQPFVNHGGQIIKAYILGDVIFQLRRPSLPNVRVPGPQSPDKPGYVAFGRVSNARDVPKVLPDDEGDVALVPEELLRLAVKQIGSLLGIKLFGVDFIRDEATGDYLVIDINYLPGYYGVANVFETLLDLFYAKMNKG